MVDQLVQFLILGMWTIVTVTIFTRSFLLHMRHLKGTRSREFIVHIKQHIWIIGMLVFAEMLLFVFLFQCGVAVFGLGHIAFGVLTITNIYIFRHLDEEVYKDGEHHG